MGFRRSRAPADPPRRHAGSLKRGDHVEGQFSRLVATVPPSGPHGQVDAACASSGSGVQVDQPQLAGRKRTKLLTFPERTPACGANEAGIPGCQQALDFHDSCRFHSWNMAAFLGRGARFQRGEAAAVRGETVTPPSFRGALRIKFDHALPDGVSFIIEPAAEICQHR